LLALPLFVLDFRSVAPFQNQGNWNRKLMPKISLFLVFTHVKKLGGDILAKYLSQSSCLAWDSTPDILLTGGVCSSVWKK